MQITPYHAKYYAYELTKQSASDSIQKLATTLVDAQVDLNPHQVEAALFAFRSPLSKGAILADEVGLGKTIEAGLVISQKWAERKRKMLIIAPSSLRKQWNQELADKFFIPSTIIEAKSFKAKIKEGQLNPFDEKDGLVICSYHFARNKANYIQQMNWDLVIIDEAHKLRNVYKPSNKIGRAIKSALKDSRKLLLTATPLQNSLLELYGLVSIIDDYAFGDLKSFKQQYSHLNEAAFFELQQRLSPLCKRTLRREVLEYIKYTDRVAILQEYFPKNDEQLLYDLVSAYLQKPILYALPPSQRQLMTLILRKLLASSTYAISGTLERLKLKLEGILREQQLFDEEENSVATDYETFENTQDEWNETENEDWEEVHRGFSPEMLEEIEAEIEELRIISNLAASIEENSKGIALLKGLKIGFEELDKQSGANRKAIIFTESRRTQDYLKELLEANGYAGELVLFNGTNNSLETKQIYKDWIAQHKGTDRISGAKSADTRAAIVDYFRNEATIMIATEAAAEGINLQFCSLLVNYDLPWNPQRIEQRIGRCHRYGQRFTVVVINFLNQRNAADRRVYELLNEKFNLFNGVFGASDEVLGSIESGVDFEKRIAAIYQNCKSEAEIQASFDALQKEMETSIEERMTTTKQKLLDHFDEEVHEKLRVSLQKSKEYLNKYQNWLWLITQQFLQQQATFVEDGNYTFQLHQSPFAGVATGKYKIGKYIQDAHTYRIGHPLAQSIIKASKSAMLRPAQLIFDYSGVKKRITILENLVGQSGWLKVVNLNINSFEQEDHVLLIGMTSKGDLLEKEQCHRLFSLAGREASLDNSKIPMGKLNELLKIQKKAIMEESEARNSHYFDDEMDKLDMWAEDVKNSLEIELKNLEKEIKTRKTEARKIPVLAEKVKEQRKIKELEKKRNTLRQNLFKEQDEVENRKDNLIDDIENRMNQRTTVTELFTIKWNLI